MQQKKSARHVFDELKSRGFIQQCSHENDLRDVLNRGKTTFYVGFDPTADSLHVGSLTPVMAMAHLQRAGHIPIAVIGGGTAMIGDPSGKTETRRIMTREEITRNGKKILAQISRFLILDGKRGHALDNAEWLLNINLIDFLRTIGSHVRVKEMIKKEGYRERLERESGLSFLEFSYQLLQAYDFLVLFDRKKCILQMGGDDQWGNITAGIDLVRRLRGTHESTAKEEKQKSPTFGLTFPLLTTARGNKMGKTESGTVWLDSEKTSPYDLYQYWINMDDRDVGRFLRMFTFLAIEEIEELEKLTGADLRIAKEALAFEVVKLAHGDTLAEEARKTARAAFQNGNVWNANIPALKISISRIKESAAIVNLLGESGIISKSEARRLVRQGGLYVNEKRIASEEERVGPEHFVNGALVVRLGKKRYYRIIME